MNVEVRYYSKSGNTKKIADAIAKQAGVSAKSIHEPIQGEVDMLFLGTGLYRIRSSRRLEALARTNVEVMWLLEKIVPDDRCIADFRETNSAAIKEVFREFSLMCSQLGMYGGREASIDSTKIRANANRHSVYTRQGTEALIVKVNEKIERYMKLLDESDAKEADEPQISKEDVRNILKHLTEKKEHLQNLEKKIKQNNGEAIGLVDPDARIMRTNGEGRVLDACYNVQAIADNEHGLVTMFEVTTDANDSGKLSEMTETAKEILGVESIEVSADKGYYDSVDIASCEQNQTTTYVPPVEASEHAPDRNYDRRNFDYDAGKDAEKPKDGRRKDE